MIINQAILSRRYAQAFIDVYGKDISFDVYKAIVCFADDMHKQRRSFFLCMAPAIPMKDKERAFYKVCDHYNLAQLFMPLIKLLLLNKRIILLDQILSAIKALYQEEHKLMSFDVSSSHPLTATDRKIIERFLARSTACDIIYTNTVDPKLIAGVRLQSETFLWEESIRKRLQAVALSVAR